MREFTFLYEEQTDVRSLIEDVKTCGHEVSLKTVEGDELSLKSTLCQFILFSLSERPDELRGAMLCGLGEEDYQRLSKYQKQK